MGESEEWINIGISISAPKEKAPEVEKLLKPYADELGWGISSSEQSESNSQITLSPEKGRISPEELRERLESIAGVSFGILKDVICLGDREKALQNYMQGLVITAAVLPQTGKEVFFLGHTIGFLWFNYEISKRLALEKEKPELAFTLFFNSTAENQLREFFQNKPAEGADAETRAKLEELYGFKLS